MPCREGGTTAYCMFSLPFLQLSEAFEQKLSDYMHQADIVTENITRTLNPHLYET